MLKLLMSIPIGILYNILVHNVNKIITRDFEYQKKIQTGFLLSLIMCIIAVVLSITVFEDNKVVKWGLYLGAGMLFINTVIFNWKILSDTIKIFLLGALMFVFIFYSYTTDGETDFYNKEESNELAML